MDRLGMTWEKRRTDIQRRFEKIVDRYDVANTFLSLGLDDGWRRLAVREGVRAAEKRSGVPFPEEGLWLDLASGTGAMARILTRFNISRVLRLDLSPVLLQDRYRMRGAPSGMRVAAETHRIPLPANSVSGALMGFATRHIPSLDEYIGEVARVLAPGAVFVLLDMDMGRGPLWGPVYRFYFRHILPMMAALLTRNGETYRWMVRTVEEGPKPETIVPVLASAGFQNIDLRYPSGGAAYLIIALR
ncbi:MAG: class I SAM-dependent methyltransferase [Candidatus Eisenbacteria bacterium]|uniref:Class I SAM-dependent methyltransferase n=1 Tax=Eiseniibacteriota bacterium TaxID=2212470 RepID=A0A948S0B6_UNCEI|nr:class I SAM-dependent methyltransferase [Candidatus Eisenbacteria bacterium]MBU1951154.1 class I SAM-dependent methyltransferase [Candidatus Eisenbacteria bacterium]MBU2692502.1 class I SAM-dependent methyltransferase [Candidatus Eisenbacteria bacterium]